MCKKVLSFLLTLCILISLVDPLVVPVKAMEESGWIPETELPEGAVVTDTRWAYTKTTKLDSKTANLAGYTLSSSEWIQSGTGSKEYATFPDGFKDTHIIYTGMAKSAYPASETATTKRTVSNKHTGYIYWHWMYNTNKSSAYDRLIHYENAAAGKNNWVYKYFGAFKSTKDYPSVGKNACITGKYTAYKVNDRSSYADTQGSWYWYRFKYYTSTYTDYYKLFHYTKTEQLSAASAPTAGTTTTTDSTNEDKTTVTISNVQKQVRYYSDFTLTYDAWGGTGAPAAQAKKFGQDVVLSTTVPTKEGYTFAGWAVNGSTGIVTYQPGDIYTLNEDATLCAEWDPLIYTITYYTTDDLSNPIISSIPYDGAERVNSTANQTGKVLLGWSKEPHATAPTYTPGEVIYNVKQDIDLYAVWADPSGTCGENVNWIHQYYQSGLLYTGELRLNGSGPTWNYENGEHWPGVEYVTHITVSEGITTLGDYLFSDLTAVYPSNTSVSLPSTLTELGIGTFRGSSAMKAISIPQGITALPEALFSGCISLNTVQLPDSLTTIGADAFEACTSLKRLTLPETVNELGIGAFRDCSNLQTINLPVGITNLPEDVFNGCSQLTLQLPKTITAIGARAFAECDSLGTFTISYEVKSIGKDAFANCDNLTIRCYEGTAAHEYAVENGILYELIVMEQLEKPTVSIDGTPSNAQVIMTGPEHAMIWYTADTDGEAILYTGPISITKTTEFQAWCAGEGYADSDAVSYTAVPSRTPAPKCDTALGASLQSGSSITFAAEDDDIEIWYSLNDEPPYVSNPGRIRYTGPVILNEPGEITVFAMAYREGWLPSHYTPYTFNVVEVLPVPTITSTTLDTIGTENARISAQIESTSALKQAEICWYEKTNSEVMWSMVVHPTSGSISHVIPGLDPSTSYSYYVKAENEYGWGVGSIGTFVTKDAVTADMQITLDAERIETYVGRSTTLMARIRPSTAESWIDWESEDPAVAAVDANGNVTGISPGTTTIIATISNGKAAHCEVQVHAQSAVGYKDFSEKHMMTHATSTGTYGVDTGPLDGGNALMATAYLARWDGTVYEADAPYPSVSSTDGSVFYQTSQAQAADLHVQSAIFLPYRTNAKDLNNIKSAIVQYGAVYTSMYEDPSCYNSGREYFYYSRHDFPEGSYFHAVSIVGWDDTISKYSFGSKQTGYPAGNGAFIIKDSRGEADHGNGYFYVSYYDTALGYGRNNDYNAVFYNLQDTEAYNKIYQHDYLGPTALYATRSGKNSSVYLANVFTVSGSQDEELKAVSFYNYAPGTNYRVYVVKDFRDENSFSRLGNVVAAGARSYTGYDTVELEESIPLEAGSDFAVVVELMGATQVFLEARVPGYSSKAVAEAGQSYLRVGKGDWTDVHADIESNANVCVKAFTKAGDGSFLLFGTEEPTADLCLDEGSMDLMSYGDSGSGALSPFLTIPGLQEDSKTGEGIRLSSKFDLRKNECVTSVKNQGGFPGCWSFAAYASLESSALMVSTRENAGNLSGAGNDTVISLNCTEAVMQPGDKLQLLATALTDNASYAARQIVWECKSSAVSVSSRGFVTAESEGTAIVTASTPDNSWRTECIITVSADAAPKSVTITNSDTTLMAGDTMRMRYATDAASSLGASVIRSNVSWNSSDEAVAKIDQTGYLQATGYGTTTVSVTVNGTVTGSIEIFVDDGRLAHVEIQDQSLNLSNGELTGNLSVTLSNFDDEEKDLAVCLAVYSTDGQLLQARMETAKVPTTGSVPLTFRNLKIPVPANKDVTFKLMLLEAGSYTPLIPVIDDGTE